MLGSKQVIRSKTGVFVFAAISLLMSSCAHNPEDFRGNLTYSLEPRYCDFVSKEFFASKDVDNFKQDSEDYFKLIAIKSGANFIKVRKESESLMMINAPSPKNHGPHTYIEAVLYACNKL